MEQKRQSTRGGRKNASSHQREIKDRFSSLVDLGRELSSAANEESSSFDLP